MDEVLTAYLQETYVVVFASMFSYYCYDINTKTKMNLRAVENELRLIFGNHLNAKKVLYFWVSTKTNDLKEIATEYKDRLYHGSISIDQLNDMLITDACTQKCT